VMESGAHPTIASDQGTAITDFIRPEMYRTRNYP